MSEEESDCESFTVVQEIHRPASAHFYRHVPAGVQLRCGAWTPEENTLFLSQLEEATGDVNIPPEDWGIFSLRIPGRPGYQCRRHYRDLLDGGELTNSSLFEGPAAAIETRPDSQVHQPFIVPLPIARDAAGKKRARFTDAEKIDVIRLHDAGRTWEQIADSTGHSKGGCYHFYDMWESTHALRRKWGRPTVIGTTTTEIVVRATESNRRSTVAAVAELAGISRETTREIRHDEGYHYYDCTPQTLMTDHAKAARVAFAEEQVANTDGLPIIFTDESTVAQDLHIGGIWRKRGEIVDERFYEREQHPLSVMVWGAIGLGFRGPLVRCPPSVNQESYRRILAESQIFATLTDRFGRDGFWWQQDNAPPHQPIRRELAKVYKVLNWPPYSPDLSPIEHMWAIVKRKLKGRRFADGDELFAAMSQAWGETSQEEIDHLCSSFNARCQVCIKHQGQSLNRHWHEVHAIHHAPGPI